MRNLAFSALYVIVLSLVSLSAHADRLASKPWVQDRLADLALAVGAVRDEDAARALRLQQEVERLEAIADEFAAKVSAAQAAYMATQSALTQLAASLTQLPENEQAALSVALAPAITNLAQQIEDTISVQSQLAQTRLDDELRNHSAQVISNMNAAVAATQVRWVPPTAPARDREVRWIAHFADIPPSPNSDESICEQRMFVLTNAVAVPWPAIWDRQHGYVTDAPEHLSPGTNLIVRTDLGLGCVLIQARNLGDLP